MRGITTFYPMDRFLEKGMKCGVIGIGGLGHMAIMFLKKMGYEVTAFTSSNKKTEMIKDLGVDHIIISSDKDQMKKAENSLDFIINTIPTNALFNEYVKCCQKGAFFIQLGVPVGEKGGLTVQADQVACKEITIFGGAVGPRKSIEKMLKLCAEKNIYPLSEEFSFEDWPKAFEKLEHGQPHFRCIVNVKDFAEKKGWKK